MGSHCRISGIGDDLLETNLKSYQRASLVALSVSNRARKIGWEVIALMKVRPAGGSNRRDGSGDGESG